MCLLLLSNTKDISSQLICLFTPKKSMLRESDPTLISYIFCIGVFCTPIRSFFLDTIIVSRYYLKFISKRICSYWMKGAFVKMILASGLLGIVAVGAWTFFDSKSFFRSVSRWYFILKSIFRGKFRVSQGNSIDVLAFELVLKLFYPFFNV